ncbi:MAG: hypothetical protein J6M95_04790 [Bacilli bacterium]|nr:hypothetical protein [Bacilli bacterium]
MANKEKSLETVINFYVEKVRAGTRRLDDVPQKIREQVQARLKSAD